MNKPDKMGGRGNEGEGGADPGAFGDPLPPKEKEPEPEETVSKPNPVSDWYASAPTAVTDPPMFRSAPKRSPSYQDKALFMPIANPIKASVLVVEDEAVVALDIQTRLIRMGYGVAGICASGEDAVIRAAQLKPSLLLMDIQLAGGMNGIAAARQIKAERDVPVIFLTAFSNDATIEQAVAVEPAGYLVKPFDDRTLKATIEIALNHRYR